MLLYSEATREGVTLHQVWEAFRFGKLDAVPMQRRTLREAVRETIDAKRGENLRERYVNELDNYLCKFVTGRSAMYVDRVGVADIERWFDSRQEALSTRKSNLGRLSAMFDVCWRRGYIKENPCLKVAAPTLEDAPPRILKTAEARSLLTQCRNSHPVLLPWLVLGLFCGIRPAELEKLRWADVDMEHRLVTIDAAASKVRRRRVVQLANLMEVLEATTEKRTVREFDPALQWLRVATPGRPEDMLTPVKSILREERTALRTAAGLEWSHDLLRHTAGSYLLALMQDAGEVANILGNSPRILERCYKDLVTPTACAEFWSLTPSACKS